MRRNDEFLVVDGSTHALSRLETSDLDLSSGELYPRKGEQPFGWASGQTNAYAYVGGNPVQRNDPLGLGPWDQKYGLSNAYWNWLHHQDGGSLIKELKDLRTGQVPKDIASEYYKIYLLETGQIAVSPIDENLLEPQVDATLRFLRTYEVEVRRLVRFPGVDAVEFRMGLFWLPDTAIYPISLAPSFLRAVGDIGATVDIYVYASDGVN
jgi:hypothetical protein